jgi:hypothetical protein
MRRILPGALLMGTLLAVPVTPVRACLNDSETRRQEKQFKSAYQDEAPRYSEPKPVGPLAALGVGGVLLAGAVVIGIRASKLTPAPRPGQHASKPVRPQWLSDHSAHPDA